MSNTSIQWTNAVWNPVRGCTRVSEGCRNCYAERMAARNLPGMNSPTTGQPFAIMTPSGPRWTGAVELIEKALILPRRWRKARRIFVNSMSDLFHEALPDTAIDRVSYVMAICPQHTFQVLTKRPERMLQYMQSLRSDQWPLPNVHMGVSVEDQETANTRIPLLLSTPAAKRFVSYEPALGPVDFSPWLPTLEIERELKHLPALGTYLDQIIVGGESGPGARPFEVEWARNTIRLCARAKVKCFIKQMGASLGGNPDEFPSAIHNDGDGHLTFRLRDPKCGDMDEWPADLRVRELI